MKIYDSCWKQEKLAIKKNKPLIIFSNNFFITVRHSLNKSVGHLG